MEQSHVSHRARRGHREDRMYSGSAGQIKPLKVCFARPTFKKYGSFRSTLLEVIQKYITGKCRLAVQDAKPHHFTLFLNIVKFTR